MCRYMRIRSCSHVGHRCPRSFCNLPIKMQSAAGNADMQSMQVLWGVVCRCFGHSALRTVWQGVKPLPDRAQREQREQRTTERCISARDCVYMQDPVASRLCITCSNERDEECFSTELFRPNLLPALPHIWRIVLGFNHSLVFNRGFQGPYWSLMMTRVTGRLTPNGGGGGEGGRK